MLRSLFGIFLPYIELAWNENHRENKYVRSSFVVKKSSLNCGQEHEIVYIVGADKLVL